MEHEANNNGSFAELPLPQEAAGQPQPENNPTAQPEMKGNRPPRAVPQSQQMSSPTNPQAAIQPVAPDSTAFVQGSTDPAALMADDADLIEKEWVIRAKAIVERTKDDPHSQNREMNKVKADYLKKRYNKDLKISEG